MKNLLIGIAAVLLTVPAVGQTTWISPGPGLSPSGNASSATVSPTGAGSSFSTTMANIAAQSGILLDTFKQAGDADDTASLTRAQTACVPVLLGNRTYTINNYVEAAGCSQFIMSGIPGASIIQRSSASGTYAFRLGVATQIYISGVTFDFNSGSVSANQWGLRMDAGGQTVALVNDVFKNNSGTNGSCVALVSTGPAAGGAFTYTNDEVTGCTFKSMYLGSVTNGMITAAYIHDNSSGTAAGAWVGSDGSASSTNYASNIVFNNPKVFRNYDGINSGPFTAPYAFGTPGAVGIEINGGTFQDNSNRNMAIENCDYCTMNGFTINQSASSVSVGYAIDCNSRYLTISNGTINLAGSTWGIDCGGAVQANIFGNQITMNSGVLINIGGNQDTNSHDNILVATGSAKAYQVLNVESDGNVTGAFPTISSGIVIQNDKISLYGTSSSGVVLYDGPGGATGSVATIVQREHFSPYNSSGAYCGPGSVTSGCATAGQDFTWYGPSSSLYIQDNDHNGASTETINPNGSNDIVYDLFADEIRTTAGATTRSIVTSFINANGGGGSLLWIYPSAGGSSYTSATTIAATCGGTTISGFAATAQINNGVILGVHITNNGSGCSGALAITASDSGGGSGATFVGGTLPRMPLYKRLRYIPGVATSLSASGGFVGLSGNQSLAVSIASGASVTLTATGGSNQGAPSGADSWGVPNTVTLSGTFANKPAATSAVTYFATDIGSSGTQLISNGTVWKPASGVATLFQSYAGGNSVTSTTGETNIIVLTVPAGLLTVNGSLRITTLWTTTNDSNNKGLVVRYSNTACTPGSACSTGTAYANFTATTTASTRMTQQIANRNSASSQVGAGIGTSGLGSTSNATVTSALNTANSTVFNIDGNPANSADTITLEGYTVEWLEP